MYIYIHFVILQQKSKNHGRQKKPARCLILRCICGLDGPKGSPKMERDCWGPLDSRAPNHRDPNDSLRFGSWQKYKSTRRNSHDKSPWRMVDGSNDPVPFLGFGRWTQGRKAVSFREGTSFSYRVITGHQPKLHALFSGNPCNCFPQN